MNLKKWCRLFRVSTASTTPSTCQNPKTSLPYQHVQRWDIDYLDQYTKTKTGEDFLLETCLDNQILLFATINICHQPRPTTLMEHSTCARLFCSFTSFMHFVDNKMYLDSYQKRSKQLPTRHSLIKFDTELLSTTSTLHQQQCLLTLKLLPQILPPMCPSAN